MIVISEYKIDKEQIKEYHDKGYRFAYLWQDPIINRGEGVAILLGPMKKETISLIEWLLTTKHKLNLKYDDGSDDSKYKDKSFKINSIDEWKYTTQSDSDMLKLESTHHELYDIYLCKRAERMEYAKKEKAEEQYELIVEEFNAKEIPNDEELSTYLSTFAPLYQVDVDYTDKINMLKSYYQIEWYLDNDIPYVNEVKGINPDDELMFEGIKFKTFYEEPIEIESFGNETYLEDYIYKNSEDSCLA